MAVTKRVSLKDFANKELPQLAQRSLEEQRRIVINAILQALPEIVKASPVDTGLYAQSWGHKVGPNSVTVGNSAPHAPVIELGARPFTPPLAPLLAWAKRVLKDPSQPPNYSSQVFALARYTQRKIAAEGMAPKHVMEKGVDIIIQNIERALRK